MTASADDSLDPELSPQSLAQCASSNFCLWSSGGYTGTFRGTTSTTIVNLPFSSAGSVRNRASKSALVFSGLNGTGTVTCVEPGTQSGSVSIPAQSMRVLTSATTC